MRRTFATLLASHMESDQDIHVLVADVGYGMFDEIARRFPDRFWNVGAAEQAMVGMGVGLALAGKKPICYSITPFLLWRPAELIRNYLNAERVPVILVGSGRDDDYCHDGPTHWCFDDIRLFDDVWMNIEAYWPERESEIAPILQTIITDRKPAYLNLTR